MEFVTVTGDASSEIFGGERLKYLRLLDVYGPLLSESQRGICENFYLNDISVSEIAAEKGITRQAVSDALKKSREIMDAYEEKLHFARDTEAYSLEVSFMMTKVTRALEGLAEKHPELAQEIGAIADMVSVGDTVDVHKED